MTPAVLQNVGDARRFAMVVLLNDPASGAADPFLGALVAARTDGPQAALGVGLSSSRWAARADADAHRTPFVSLVERYHDHDAHAGLQSSSDLLLLSDLHFSYNRNDDQALWSGVLRPDASAPWWAAQTQVLTTQGLINNPECPSLTWIGLVLMRMLHTAERMRRGLPRPHPEMRISAADINWQAVGRTVLQNEGADLARGWMVASLLTAHVPASETDRALAGTVCDELMGAVDHLRACDPGVGPARAGWGELMETLRSAAVPPPALQAALDRAVLSTAADTARGMTPWPGRSI